MLKTLWFKTAPWLAGAGIAGGQAGLATRCTVPQQGVCSGCGSCAVVVASLVTWAVVAKKRRGGDFYTVTTEEKR
ncbi:hypothetical protein MIT9_P1075 [Methylomarinovum caldicuralii]|uniref:Uncharacterized protein n=1 Tax=Methylomarinovum caldicuralii TaxID=438856 RepID=A0AAU9BZK5_9GAMM|nr:hypothetical protein [Methylomarinovum caldicuralii]BCX81497.1 hypothetical protein MIT9_P1075 [Methylomarinovum caldicuralii]